MNKAKLLTNGLNIKKSRLKTLSTWVSSKRFKKMKTMTLEMMTSVLKIKNPSPKKVKKAHKVVMMTFLETKAQLPS